MAVNVQSVNRQPKIKTKPRILGDAFKAGLIGGLAISVLLWVYQISIELLRIALVPAALIIVWIVTGIGAAMLAGNKIKTSQEGGIVGVIAGLVSGVVQGINSMIIAAFGLTFTERGQGVLAQFSDSQLTGLLESGITSNLIVLSGSIIAAMFVCGVGGMFVSALLGGFGGWLYPKFGK